jgi:hypothetical protein
MLSVAEATEIRIQERLRNIGKDDWGSYDPILVLSKFFL